MDPITHQQFFTEVMEFRKLMGDRAFWAKSIDNRNIAKKALGIAYLNTTPIADKIADIYMATMAEYDQREQYLVLGGKASL